MARHLLCCSLLLFSFLCCLTSFCLADDPPPAIQLPQDPSSGAEFGITPGKAVSPQAEREAQFAKLLTGATLNGHFTLTGKQPAGQPKLMTERYDLVEVRKVDDKHWLFKARIRYGEHDVTLPMTLPVVWAGDTPVVTVDNIGFPGLGTYSARVLFHKDHYAGHWNGTNYGGHLFGTIERQAKEPAPAE